MESSNAFTIPAQSALGKTLNQSATKARKEPSNPNPVVFPNSYKNLPPKMMEKRK